MGIEVITVCELERAARFLNRNEASRRVADSKIF